MASITELHAKCHEMNDLVHEVSNEIKTKDSKITQLEAQNLALNERLDAQEAIASNAWDEQKRNTEHFGNLLDELLQELAEARTLFSLLAQKIRLLEINVKLKDFDYIERKNANNPPRTKRRS